MNFLKLTSVLVLTAFVVAGCGGSVEVAIGGKVTGLATGTSVELMNNSNGDKLTVNFNDSDNKFEFGTKVPQGTSYNVVVTKAPTGYTCPVTNGVNTAGTSDVDDIMVNCAPGTSTPVPVYASVVGLAAGNSVVLLLNGDHVNTLTVTPPTTTMLAFPVTLLPNAPFVVSVDSVGPTPQKCEPESSASGSIPASGGSPAPAVISCS